MVTHQHQATRCVPVLWQHGSGGCESCSSMSGRVVFKLRMLGHKWLIPVPAFSSLFPGMKADVVGARSFARCDTAIVPVHE